MRTFNPNHWIAFALAAACSVSHAADAFAPPGAKATLSVDFVYESAGKKRSEGMYDPYEWRARRSMNLAADLVAQPATAMPTVQAIDAAQMAELQRKSDKAQAISGQMAPLAAEAQKAIAKCGNDEACMTREAMKMAAAMQGTPQMAAAMNAKKDAQELGKPGAMRYQAWRPTAQRGTYNIDESVHISVTDPICTSKPRHRCTRDEVRKGSGEIPVPAEAKTKQNKGATAGLSAVEVDAAKNSITVGLPTPLSLLPYTETITTDEPAGTHDTPTPKGPQPKQLLFRVSTAGSGIQSQPFTVPLKGGWRSQSGEQVMNLKGDFADGGTLKVSWRFAVQ
ncbi:MAG: hypothetical protein ABI409_19300 [Ramlibacter sp.]